MFIAQTIDGRMTPAAGLSACWYANRERTISRAASGPGAQIRQRGRKRVTGRARLAAAVTAMLLATSTLAQAGRWTYHEDRNDGHILKYLEDEKVVFELACGRGFALLARHPAKASTDGKTRITLAAGKSRTVLAGDFVPSLDKSVTNFHQAYLGHDKNDPAVYGKRWQQAEERLLDLIGSQAGFTVSAGAASYHLPAIDIERWRRPFELCGYGFWVSPSEFPAETP